MSEPATSEENPRADWKISVALSVVILAAAGGLATLTFMTEPTAERGGATKKTAMLVDVVEAEQGSWRPQIVVQGSVEAAREIVLQPQVAGRVTSVAEEFTPGGYLQEGQRILQIERADFENALAQRKSELRQAKTDLAVEKGRHEAATAEYQRFGEDLAPEDKSLVLRQPQLEAAEERVRAAEAAVEQAKLNLRRTTLRAPFDASVLTRRANLGSQVAPGDGIARLVGVEKYWVALEVPLSKMRWLSIEGEDGEGSTVRVRNDQAWPTETYREGHLFKKVGALDENTRMARVLAEIPDPLARETKEGETPELTIGEFVRVTIRGEKLDGVVRLDRDYVRQDDTVWVMKEGELEVREVEILVRDPDWAYISEGLESGERVVATNLSTVVEGAPLRLKQTEEGASGE